MKSSSFENALLAVFPISSNTTKDAVENSANSFRTQIATASRKQLLELEKIINEAAEWDFSVPAFVFLIVDRCADTGNGDIISNLFAKASEIYPPSSIGWRNIVEKGVTLFSRCQETGMFALADDLLEKAYKAFPPGSMKRRQVAEEGLKLVDRCAESGMLDLADNFLERAYLIYPACSEEKRNIVKKRKVLVDVCIDCGEFDTAKVLLSKAYGVYPSGSQDELDVLRWQGELKAKMLSSKLGQGQSIRIEHIRVALGNGVNIQT